MLRSLKVKKETSEWKYRNLKIESTGNNPHLKVIMLVKYHNRFAEWSAPADTEW